MNTTRVLVVTLAASAVSLIATASVAQPLGTFTWQLQPFCNVVTVNVTQQGAVYTMDGYDDQCGAARRAPIVGLGTPNPDGTIGLGWNIVTTPGGRGVQVDARITLPSASGSWSDSAGNAGTLALGASTGGNPRPLPAAPATGIPATFSLRTDGGFLAGGTEGVGAIPTSGSGTRMMWYPSKAAFRAGSVAGGEWDDVNIGAYSAAVGYETVASGTASLATGGLTTASNLFSTAMGYGTTASGAYSTAMGISTTASGTYSTAMGLNTSASGSVSTAMGDHTTASGIVSTATGSSTIASGQFSTALGLGTTASGYASLATGQSSVASGDYSTAMGRLSTASGGNSTAIGTSLLAQGGASVVMGVRAATTAQGNGSFVYGDQSTGQSGSIVTSSSSNQFLVRAAGGTIFYSNAAMTSGVQLTAGGGGWSNLSDVHLKTEFRELDGEHVLGKLAAMPVREWRYTTQDPAIRHVGPTAQDFRAAFGLGESDLRIGTVDADGIALAAVKALEARTREMNTTLARQNDALRESLAELKREIAALRRAR